MDMLDKSYKLVLQGFSKKKQREILDLCCCGTECKQCSYYGNHCAGCNEASGKVFHMPSGKTCPIYNCSVQKCKFATCAECDNLPCSIWHATKDPSFSKQEFEQNIQERIGNLKGDHF